MAQSLATLLADAAAGGAAARAAVAPLNLDAAAGVEVRGSRLRADGVSTPARAGGGVGGVAVVVVVVLAALVVLAACCARGCSTQFASGHRKRLAVEAHERRRRRPAQRYQRDAGEPLRVAAELTAICSRERRRWSRRNVVAARLLPRLLDHDGRWRNA